MVAAPPHRESGTGDESLLIGAIVALGGLVLASLSLVALGRRMQAGSPM